MLSSERTPTEKLTEKSNVRCAKPEQLLYKDYGIGIYRNITQDVHHLSRIVQHSYSVLVPIQ